MNRVAIKPELLRWACERAGYSMVDLEPQFPQLGAWDRGEEQPTLRQAENFARTTHIQQAASKIDIRHNFKNTTVTR
jgi:hypothetical protein